MINYVYGEQLYQEFVSFRDLFLKKAVARAQHVDAASDGRPVRPVGKNWPLNLTPEY